VKAVWGQASARARRLIAAFVTTQLRAIVEAKRRSEASETGRPDGKHAE
jgi:hypothetical protein